MVADVNDLLRVYRHTGRGRGTSLIRKHGCPINRNPGSRAPRASRELRVGAVNLGPFDTRAQLSGRPAPIVRTSKVFENAVRWARKG